VTERALGPTTDRRFTLATIGAVVAVAATAVSLQLGSAEFQRNLSNVLEIVAPALAVWASVQAGRRASGRGWRIGWYMIAASCASWGLGQVVWTWFETIQGQTTPFPSMADFFYLCAIPLAVGGLLAMPSSSDDRRDRVRVVLDGFIVACALLFVSWVTVLGPTLASATGSWLERTIALAYPAGDVIVLTMVLVTCGRSDPAGRVAIGLSGLGFAAFALADSLFVYTSLRSDMVSNLSNDAWVAGYLLIALGALHASHRPPARVSELSRRTPERMGRSPMFLLPYVPVAVVLGLCVTEAVVNDPIVVGDAEFLIGTALIVALLARQAFVILENGQLARSLAASNEQLHYQLLHDDLTGLPNRPLLLDRVRVALARMERSRTMAAVMFVDLDLFKQANDTYGHEAGDLVLIAVGRRLLGSLRAGDTVARFGGDEFVVLCEDVPSAGEANHLAERVIEAVTQPVAISSDVQVVVQASIGLVLVDDPGTRPEDIVRDADGAMYRAKRNGRARVEVVDDRRPAPVHVS
jgi:diguanylate cyclase (GGDEF)-like protein